MNRRTFVSISALSAAIAATPHAFAALASQAPVPSHLIHRLALRTQRLGERRIAVWHTGSGPAALFIHGWPLNGIHWRDSLRGLAKHRTCIAPDLMGLGYSDVPSGTDLSPNAQAAMLFDLMNSLGHAAFDIVANDSGTAIAQIMIANSPGRVRSAILTNGDAHINSPPAALAPALDAAKSGQLEHLIRLHVTDPTFASSEAGLGTLCYADPTRLSADLISAYFKPLLSSPLRIAQFQEYGVAFTPNPLVELRGALRRYEGPVSILWGDNDMHFPMEWAYWLDGLFAKSRGVTIVPGGKLFFTEENPDSVVSSAIKLWEAG